MSPVSETPPWIEVPSLSGLALRNVTHPGGGVSSKRSWCEWNDLREMFSYCRAKGLLEHWKQGPEPVRGSGFWSRMGCLSSNGSLEEGLLTHPMRHPPGVRSWIRVGLVES